MNLVDTKLKYDVCESEDSGIPAIIVAAGASSRMNGEDKQLMMLLGIPVIVRTLFAFQNSTDISKIIIVASPKNILDIQRVCDKYLISKVTDIVVGGNTRQESVMCGIKALGINDSKVIIHDGARPLADNKIIGDVVKALNSFDAAVCVSKINDTVKSVDANGIITSTVDRSFLYSAQTPQGVDVEKYILACDKVKDFSIFTDDASIMEAAGYKVKAVEGSRKNIKITTSEDLFIAEAFIKEEG